MKRSLVLIKLLVLILVACASPVAGSADDPEPIDTTAEPAAQPQQTLEANPTAEPQSASGPQAQTLSRPEGTSSLAYEDAILMLLWGARTGELHAVDPATGQDVEGYAPIEFGGWSIREQSPDGSHLAAIVYPTSSSQMGGVLHLLDLSAWQDTATSLEYDVPVNELIFSPDGSRLVIALERRSKPALEVIDLASQTVVAETQLPVYAREIGFTADGRSIAVYGPEITPGSGVNPDVKVVLLDAATLAVDWEMDLPNVRDGQYVEEGEPTDDPHLGIWWQPAVILDSSSSTLYIVHANDNFLTTVDFAGRTVDTVEIAPQASLLDRVMALTAQTAHAKVLNGNAKYAALSPDGQHLYVIGEHVESTETADHELEMTFTPLGLQVVEAATGVEVARLDTEATDLRLSPDGLTLYLYRWGRESAAQTVTEVVDAQTLEVVSTLEGYHAIPATTVSGAPVVISTGDGPRYATIATMDPRTLATIHEWRVDGFGEWLFAW